MDSEWLDIYIFGIAAAACGAPIVFVCEYIIKRLNKRRQKWN